MKGNKKTVLVGLSGGVDSAVAAGMLLREGYEVIGLYLQMTDTTGGLQSVSKIADALKIELITLDVRGDFEQIIDYFVSEYARGRTPNPCIRCNAKIKFAHLLEQADKLNIDYVATGHHARIIDGFIYRAFDKDQSYALFELPREYLPRIIFPLGGLRNKQEVHNLAKQMGLSSLHLPDSQEICFVKGDYTSLLRQRRPEVFRKGNIVNTAGEVLGKHDGIVHFTIGQRRGLGVALGKPMYVIDIDPLTATVTIGDKHELESRYLYANDANWHDLPADDVFEGLVRIRYNHPGCLGRVHIIDEQRFEVDFIEPAVAITPGQAAVIYQGDKLLGGGWIEKISEKNSENQDL